MPRTRIRVKVRTLAGLRFNAYGAPSLVLNLADRAQRGEHVRIAGESQVYRLVRETTICQASKTERWEVVAAS